MSRSAKQTGKRVTTLRGLAEYLDLSPTTVSFVLNGHAERCKISPKTAERVLAAADKFDYVPNALARGLRQQRTHAIGVVLPHLRGDWAHRILRGVTEGLAATQTVPIMVCHFGQGDLERDLLATLVERRVDGILCNPLGDGAERYQRVVQRNVPLVFLGDRPPGAERVGSVAWDPAAVRVAVRHLIDHGHERIAYLGVQDEREISRQRREIYHETLRAAGLPCPAAYTLLESDATPLHDPIRRLLSSPQPPTAFFALYDDIATRALDQFRADGVRCPEDISLITIGGSPVAAAPGYEITTVTGDIEAEGRAAADLLLRLIEKPKGQPTHELVRTATLRIGRTTGPPPGSGHNTSRAASAGESRGGDTQ